MKTSVVKLFSQNQLLTALLVLGIGWLVIEIRGVLIALFVSYILMAAISPYVELLRRLKIPKPIAVIIPYFIAIAFLFLIILSLLPFFVVQVELLFARFPSYLNQDVKFLDTFITGSKLNALATSELENIGKSAFTITSKVFGGIFSAISVFAISFYFLLYRDTVRKSFASLFPKHLRDRVDKISREAEDKLGSWLRGQIVLSGFIGVLTWIVLTFLGIDFALSLAVIAGILELIPTIGPILSAIPAIIVALNISIPMALFVAVSYFLIQLLENNILVPRIMGRAVGLNPIIIIIGIIVGGKLLGVAGALLAIPAISLLVVVYKNLE